jgi:hypothetical protein
LNELGLHLQSVLPWFVSTPQQAYTRISIPAGEVATWGAVLRDAVRRAYISDERLAETAVANHVSTAAVLGAKLPDPGPIMSGDFGEIIGYIYLASVENGNIVGPKRWRFKVDRTRAAQGSDVVQMVLPNWPTSSADDRLICAEVKAKATASLFAPIASAIAGAEKDRTSRVSKSLVWMKEQALFQDIGAVTIGQLDRFIQASEHPPYARQFKAIVVVCSGLVDGEIALIDPATVPAGCALVVMDVPNLRQTYMELYEAVHASAFAVTQAGQL